MIIEIAPTSPGKKQTRAGPLRRCGFHGVETIGLVRGALTYFASRRSAPTTKALASSNRRRRKAGSSIR